MVRFKPVRRQAGSQPSPCKRAALSHCATSLFSKHFFRVHDWIRTNTFEICSLAPYPVWVHALFGNIEYPTRNDEYPRNYQNNFLQNWKLVIPC